ncbi:hypothetical protein UlMin_006881 [Ulmus minor]
MEGGGLVEPARNHKARQVSRVGYVRKMIEKKKCRRRIRKVQVPKVPIRLQELFLSCKEVFKGPATVPLPQDVQRLCGILDNMRAEDFGLGENLQFFKPNNTNKGTPRVTQTTVYECTNFSLCIFFLPTNGVIPLHNHPGMTVFSKLLLGSMHIKSYDWIPQQLINKDDSSRPSQLGLARLKANNVFAAPCETSVLYPTTGGNIHEFTAITPCAVLDVLGPPYSKQDGRDCSYYKDHPYASYSNGEITKQDGESYGWLEEIEMPEIAKMVGIEYLGPQIIENW